MVNIMHVEKELFESFSVGHTHTGAEPGKYFGVGWKYNINTDSIREFYLIKKKKITPYTGGIRDIMKLVLQNKFYK